MPIYNASRGDIINDIAIYYNQQKPRALVVTNGDDDDNDLVIHQQQPSAPQRTSHDLDHPAIIWSIPAPIFKSFLSSSPYITSTLQHRTWLRSQLTHHELFTDVDDERMREHLVARFRRETVPEVCNDCSVRA